MTALQRLAALRRTREKRALEALTAEAGLLRRAEQLNEEATRAVRDQVRHARNRERELIGALSGRSVSQAAILQVQAALDGAAGETSRLRAAETHAQADLLARRNARAEALAYFQRRRRATAKLDVARKQEAASVSRWETAVGDADHEEHRAAANASRLP